MSEIFPELTTEMLLKLEWKDFEGHYAGLENEAIHENNIADWLARWTAIGEILEELYNRAYVATSANTADKEAESRFDAFMENIYPHVVAAEQKLKQKLLVSGLSVAGFEIPLRNMQAEADIFREANIPLHVQVEKLSNTYDKITGAQAIQWKGEEKTVRQMEVVLREKDPGTRLAGWQAMSTRQLEDRQAINDLWVQYMEIRAKMAENAGMPGYRDLCWREKLRFDYSPEDCKSFHNAIEEVVVPIVGRLAERRKKALGLDTLRYCDILVDLSDAQPLKPFSQVGELKRGATEIFTKVHPRFGAFFKQMDEEGLLDLENRKNKANGAYCTDLPHIKRPFIFGNAIGIHDDVQTVLHEGGHGFHCFAYFNQPYLQQRSIPMEFAEVASMGMELLGMRYLAKKDGGFYSDAEAARAQAEHLEQSLMFWPYMAIVDAFQHWVYENPSEGINPGLCDAKWAELEDRFRPYINWDGYEDVKMTGWHRKPHIHQSPFYYVEYGLAQLGAAQIWKNSLTDERNAVDAYYKALSLGGTVTLPALFETAGAKFAFDAGTLRGAAEQMEQAIYALESAY
jgi:oligoendopeptidase F